jgi:hypothetical protein
MVYVKDMIVIILNLKEDREEVKVKKVKIHKIWEDLEEVKKPLMLSIK